MFLSFNNGKKIDLSMLKEGIDVQNDNFFKNYDKNKNSIFDAEEIAQIQEDLTNAAGNDAVLSEKEALSFYAKIMNKTVEQVQNLFKKEDNTNAYSAIEQLFVDQAENETKAKMQADVDNAIEIYNQAQGGVISKGCNNLKELFNTQYAGDKVYRQIMNKQVSTWLLEEADSSDELTKKEYIERKVQLLLKFIDAEKMTGKEIASIEAGLLKSTEEELQEFLDRLVNAENDEYSQVVKQTITELNKKAYTFNELDNAFKGVNPKSLEAILNGKEGEKKLDFKTAFQFENGIEFDEEKIFNAKNKAQIASINLSVSLKINSLREGLKNSALGLSSAISQPSAQESYKEQKYDQLSETILKTLREWLGNDEQKIADAIKTYGGNAAQIKDGKIVFETNLTGKAGNSAEMLVALANDVSNAMFETLDKFLGEKSIEEYLADAEESDRNAYGVKNPIHVAEKFQESQFKMLSGVKFAVMGAAGLVGAMSSGLLVPVLSSIVGSGLSLGVSALDSATDEKGYTAEDREAIKQELKMNAIYLPTGMAIGGASSALVGNLTKCTGFLRWLAEAGPDTAMSLLADLAITGEIDLKGEGIAQLMNIAMYVVAGAKVHRATVDISSTKTKQDIGNSKPVDMQSTKAQGKTLVGIDINHKFYKELNNLLKKTERSEAEIVILARFLDKYPEQASTILKVLENNKNIKIHDNNAKQHIDTLVEIIKQNPQFKTEIENYMSVQRYHEKYTGDPFEDINRFIKTLEKYPNNKREIEIFSKNTNFNSGSMEFYIIYLQQNPHLKDDILYFASKNYGEQGINLHMRLIKSYPELRNILIADSPKYELIDKNPDITPANIITKRSKIEKELLDIAPRQMRKIKKTLGEEYYKNVKWEEIILQDVSPKQVEEILNNLNKSSKFFARIKVNEKRYGKDIDWADEMNKISQTAKYLIETGIPYENIVNIVAELYRSSDMRRTLPYDDSGRREFSGVYRGNSTPNEDAITPFDNDNGYEEYYDAFTSVSSKRKSEYNDIALTNIIYSKKVNPDRGAMYHPENRYVNPSMKRVEICFENLQPYFDKVKKGQNLTKSDIKYIDNQIAEMYFIIANVMPWARGTNGINDIFIRSVYISLGIDKPALKQGRSLDLEAFTMDLDKYKRKWNSFFEKE